MIPERSKSSCVLTINGGSSSIRFGIFEMGKEPLRRLTGKISGIGSRHSSFSHSDGREAGPISHRIAASDHRHAALFLLDWLETQPLFGSVSAVGHRVVHGVKRSEPARITPGLLGELHRAIPYAPDHLPREIELMEAIQSRHRKLPQVACFDTAFHRTMPRIAKLLPIPRRYARKGIQRYGFHGLSYAFLMEELARLGDPAAATGRVILAHLGSGASLAAVRNGQSVDTSMGLTPSAGLVMATRSGDLDPGLAFYLARNEHLTTAKFQHLVTRESGLLGISGTSSDLRDLCTRAATDPRAAEAVDIFCYQARKWTGSFAAALGGLDVLVFAGGIGENNPAIRASICHDLAFLGVELDRQANAENLPLISTTNARVRVRVIPTNEELMIARYVCRFLERKPLL
ncbi:MAG TPA: acetate/propionate family kinase [Candidatus Limnocylindria bacterium]|nr:acetate/propionate family kinase [Candidatus Limnocylindria bacterium]